MIFGEDAPATTQFNGSVAMSPMPMRDRLQGAVVAASPAHKSKLPLQLPPPPPGMPAAQVEKWRREVAKIVLKQVFLYLRCECGVFSPVLGRSVLAKPQHSALF